MREILFRGQNPYTGKWSYGKLTELKEKHNHIEAGFYLSNGAGMPFAFHVSGNTVGQVAGIEDKYGMKRFEGEIIRYGNFGKMPEPNISIDKVVWKNGCFTVDDESFSNILDLDVEVIGNIIDTPELLGEKGKEE
jgi:hypothetical protein